MTDEESTIQPNADDRKAALLKELAEIEYAKLTPAERDYADLVDTGNTILAQGREESATVNANWWNQAVYLLFEIRDFLRAHSSTASQTQVTAVVALRSQVQNAMRGLLG